VMQMKYRRLGTNGPQVSAISMGRGSQPIRFGEPLEQDFNAAIRRAYELGITFFDSSDAYWERATKYCWPSDQGLSRQGADLVQVRQHRPADGKKATNGVPSTSASAARRA